MEGYGVAVILPTSKAGDGVHKGYDLPMIRAIKEVVSADVAASGGAGELEHFYQAVVAGATVLLAASVFHFGVVEIGTLKTLLREKAALKNVGVLFKMKTVRRICCAQVLMDIRFLFYLTLSS